MKTQIELAYDYYLSHQVSKAEASKKYGFEASYLSVYIKRKGLPNRVDEGGVTKPFATRNSKPHKYSLDLQSYEMFLSGASLEEIYEATRRTIHHIKRYVERNNLPSIEVPPSKNNKQGKSNVELTKQALAWKHEFNETYQQASEKFNVPSSTLRAYHHYHTKKKNKK